MGGWVGGVESSFSEKLLSSKQAFQYQTKVYVNLDYTGKFQPMFIGVSKAFYSSKFMST